MSRLGPRMRKQRLDDVLIRHGLARDQREVFILVTGGRVFVNGQKAVSPAQPLAPGGHIEIREDPEFVSRAGNKLEAAVEKFKPPIQGSVCADIGAATGGFVEVLLKYGAKKVYAIDAGHGKLALKLREDPRVIVREGQNVLAMPRLDEPIDCITIDVSLTSLRLVLHRLRHWLGPRGAIIALFKPQYEVEDKRLLQHGILEDAGARGQTLQKFRTWLNDHAWQELGCMESPLRGSQGNVEYLLYLKPFSATAEID